MQEFAYIDFPIAAQDWSLELSGLTAFDAQLESRHHTPSLGDIAARWSSKGSNTQLGVVGTPAPGTIDRLHSLDRDIPYDMTWNRDILEQSIGQASFSPPRLPQLKDPFPSLPSPVEDSLVISPLPTPGPCLGQTTNSVIGPDDSLNNPMAQRKVKFLGSDPEHAIGAVYMMRSFLQQLRDSTSRHSTVHFGGQAQAQLHEEIMSARLCIDVEDAAASVYESSARSIWRKQMARERVTCEQATSSTIHGAKFISSPSMSSSPMNAPVENMDLLRLTSVTAYCSVYRRSTTDGVLKITLRQERKGGVRQQEHQGYYVAISVIPQVYTRQEAAISAIFPRGFSGEPMYPLIRTFNVVPEDSKIIDCVRRNDLNGFKRLIDEKLASPRDVSPNGLSLLQVRLFSSQN